MNFKTWILDRIITMAITTIIGKKEFTTKSVLLLHRVLADYHFCCTYQEPLPRGGTNANVVLSDKSSHQYIQRLNYVPSGSLTQSLFCPVHAKRAHEVKEEPHGTVITSQLI